MSVAFGIPQASDGTGTTASDMRQILGRLWESTGVVGGLAVTGTTSLGYEVAPGVAICSRGAADGMSEAYFPGGSTPAVAANAAGVPRIDVVWLAAHDSTQGDADNLVALGVAQGTPSTSPVAPSIPTFATPLAYVTLPAGATTTANATVADVAYAVPYGASLGVLLDRTDTSYKGIKQSHGAYTFASGAIMLSTDRTIDVDLTISVWAWEPATYAWMGSGYVDWLLDGEVQSAYRFVCTPETPVCLHFRDTRSVRAGSHTVSARLWPSGSAPASGLWLDYSKGSWPGQRLVVRDGGVAR
uniref:hypothetical protein n=1 Tax=Olsenella uli TaxID=133926 RepID=UPI0028ED2AE1|nr:hypothetical protein [Olsenella uli]